MVRSSFRFHPFVTLTTAFIFVVVALSGMTLFLLPNGRGRIGMFLSLSKHEWADIHIVFGFSFVVVGLIHAYLNRRALLSYFSGNKQKGIRPEWLASFALVMLLLLAVTVL